MEGVEEPLAGVGRGREARRLWAWLAAAPPYPPNAGDLRTVDVLGLRLPVRATVAVVTVTILLLLDYHGRINGLVEAVAGPFGTTVPDLRRAQALGRLVMQGLVPLLVVLLVLRDRPSRYGLRLGDARAGLAIALGGVVLMVPIVLALVRVPDFVAYYAPQATTVPGVVVTTALEVVPAEFFYRGFLLFALLRITGPIAVVIATLPFAFAHLGKPEYETLSTLGGGLLYGWLDWRTGSVLWSGLAHTAILSLAIVAAGAASGRGRVTRDEAPAEVVELAEARAAARRARDWAAADALRARIEDAGWRVVDAGTLYTLERAAPPDSEDDGRTRYGSSASVPSRLDEAPTGVATVVLVATDWPDDLARAIAAFVEHAPDGTQLVVVANGPSDEQAAALVALEAAEPGRPGIATEVLWTSARLGHAAALNAAIRRAAAPVVLLVDTSVEPAGDLVSALVAALEDATVAVAGPFGLVSPDLRRFEEPREDVVDVDAIEGYALAFRRADFVARGPLDEHFAYYRNLDIWWSLVLRDQPEDAPDDAPPRRAVRVRGVEVARHEHRGWTSLPEAERERLSKKNFYRILKRFATRRDLLVGPGRPA